MKEKILILEDEIGIRSFVSINLKREGYDIIEAGTGQEAIEKIDSEDGGKSNERKYLDWNFDTICRNNTWGCNGIFYEKGNEWEDSKRATWICIGGDDCSIGMVTSDSCN